MDNFFKKRRDGLRKTQRAMAIACNVTEKTIAHWENDVVVPSAPIATLASAYEVPEKRMEQEVMALRRRIEARESVSST